FTGLLTFKNAATENIFYGLSSLSPYIIILVCLQGYTHLSPALLLALVTMQPTDLNGPFSRILTPLLQFLKFCPRKCSEYAQLSRNRLREILTKAAMPTQTEELFLTYKSCFIPSVPGDATACNTSATQSEQSTADPRISSDDLAFRGSSPNPSQFMGGFLVGGLPCFLFMRFLHGWYADMETDIILPQPLRRIHNADVHLRAALI
ncbi:unnamed protein product, partial [Somion occarium]